MKSNHSNDHLLPFYQLSSYLPKSVQTILLSATLNEEVQTLKSIYLHNPATLKLNESAELPDPLQLQQYQISCNDEEDKFVLLYSIMKLQLVRGKSLIFVNTVNRCYKYNKKHTSTHSFVKLLHIRRSNRLKLFLENFGIRSCALNSELPINSRMHIIEQFNNGLYDTIIASDEKLMEEQRVDEKEQADAAENNNKKPTRTRRLVNFCIIFKMHSICLQFCIICV